MNWAKPAWLADSITFPGVVARQLVRVLICRSRHLVVRDVCYFRTEEPTGFVRHELPASLADEIILLLVPFVACTLAGSCLSLPAAIPMMLFDVRQPHLFVLIWLGVSIATHSFPDDADVERLKRRAVLAEGWRRWASSLLRVIATFGSVGRVIWFDIIYGACIVVLVPRAAVEWAWIFR